MKNNNVYVRQKKYFTFLPSHNNAYCLRALKKKKSPDALFLDE